MKVILSENLADIERWVYPDLTSRGKLFERTDKTTRTLSNAELNGDQTVQVEYGKEVFDRAQKDGREAGYQQGIKLAKEEAYAQALMEANAKYESAWQEKIKILNHLLEKLAEPLKLIDEEVENNLLALVIELTRRLYLNELQIKPEQILTIIRKAASALPITATNIKLYVNPDDMALIKEVLKGEQYQHIEADANLARGDCRFKAEGAEVDATFEKRLDNITQQVFKDVNS
ncbi:MAG: hypothetical protein KIT27_00845 [Legionellales bacterium]|nr:hypothetical protein [Legionellales bacterium]